MENKFFTSTHSVKLINLDYVIYATSEGPHGGSINIHMSNGDFITLEDIDATNFREVWRTNNNKREPEKKKFLIWKTSYGLWMICGEGSENLAGVFEPTETYLKYYSSLLKVSESELIKEFERAKKEEEEAEKRYLGKKI